MTFYDFSNVVPLESGSNPSSLRGRGIDSRFMINLAFSDFSLILSSLLSLLNRGLTSPSLAEGFDFHGCIWNLALDMLQLDLSVLHGAVPPVLLVPSHPASASAFLSFRPMSCGAELLLFLLPLFPRILSMLCSNNTFFALVCVMVLVSSRFCSPFTIR